MTQNISAAEVNKLRKMTGAGIMDCKKALVESNGDIEQAVDALRKKGSKVAESRKDRAANEGLIVAKVSDDKKQGVLIELNCETDFVAKNSEFIESAEAIGLAALEANPNSLEELMRVSCQGKKISDLILDLTGKIGEKITVSKFNRMNGTFVTAYTHSNKLGVLVSLNKHDESLGSVAKDVAMQIAAMSPVAIDKKDVDNQTVEREMEIAKEQIKAEGKPDHLVEKIAQGKLNKFYKEATLLNQDFVKDGSKTVQKHLNEQMNGLTVEAFIRIQLGV